MHFSNQQSRPNMTLLLLLHHGVFAWMIAWPLILIGFWILLPYLPSAWIAKFTQITTEYTITGYTPWLGLLASVVPIAIHFLLCFNVVRLLRHWKAGEIFSEETTRLFSRIGFFYLINAFVNIIMETLTTLIMTLGNSPGHRTLSLGLDSTDLSNLGIAGFLYVLTFVMKQAYQLQQESHLTV